MNASHEELLDDVAAYALGALPAAEVKRVRAHIDTCGECRAEYEALLPAVTALGSSVESCHDEVHGAVVASPLLKARIMRDVRHEAKAPGRMHVPWHVVAAASIVIALGSSLYAYTVQERINHLQTRVAHEDDGQQQMLDDVKNPKAKRFPVSVGEVVVVHHSIYLTLVDLPSLPDGKVYQAWTLHKGAKAVAPSVTFSPDKRGVALVDIPIDAETTAAVALSVEPAGGSKAPTSTPLFVRTLSP